MDDIFITAIVVVAIIAFAAVKMTNIINTKDCPSPPSYVCDGGGTMIKQKAADGSIVIRCTIKP